jgi:hypothetical protein
LLFHGTIIIIMTQGCNHNLIEETDLRMCEISALRRIFGPKRGNEPERIA